MRMHPQSELENYKLQVELLQEKLHRSEDNRQELEEKLEQIMKKRNEHERTLRSRSQLKYQQFLDEQKKRNERNRKLVEMLEQIDQQATALSARSERLKMMKLQYELYFSKLVQSYSMKTLQSIPSVPLRSIQRPSNISATLRSEDETVSIENFQTPSFNNTPQFQRVPLPVVIPIPNEQNRYQPSWTFASAPPGVLIALPNNTPRAMSSDNVENKKIQSNFCFDYSQFPIGYLQAATTSPLPMQYNVAQASYLQQPHQQQKPSVERHTKPLFAADDDIKQSRPHFEFRVETPSSTPFADVKTNETISNRTQSNQLISEQRVCGNKSEKSDDLKFNEDKERDQESQNFKQTGVPMFNKDLPVPHQSLKVDKLPNIKLSNSFQQQLIPEGRRIVHEGNIPNTIDFRTDSDNDDNKYVKYIKEMEQTYEENFPIPISLTPQELSIDNITTTLQKRRKQKIDEANVGDDEKINDMDDNEKNTSSASSAPLDGKCSIESVGDEASTFMKQPLEYKTEKHISNTAPARNIDPSRDTEQITLFNGTKNSKDESTRASNRTTAIIDGDVGENKENTENIENTRMEPSSNPSTNIYRPPHFDKKEKMSIEHIETAIYGELLTKPENLTSSETAVIPSDNLGGNRGGDKEIEQNSQQTKGYELTNLEQNSYEQDPVIGEEHQQVAPYATEIEQIEAKHDVVAENPQESYPYSDNNVSSIEEQQYDMQNYSYLDPSAVSSQEGVPQEEYSYSDAGQLPQGENYATDYQNYDASQYQAEYDQSGYQYDYSQAQYDESNQQQYAPEAYSQEYQQDQYAEEYANYDQVLPNEGETSNEAYTEEGYAPVDQEAAANQIEQNYSSEQEVVEAEKDNKHNLEKLTETPYKGKTNPESDRNPEPESTDKISQPTSILSTEKNSDVASKKKKRVNFVDSETDESSTQQKQAGVSSESDFDFSVN